MEGFMIWLGFIGAWLLFAGPIYQAALELKEEDIALDRIRAAGAKVQRPPKSSIWWWLIPPYKIYLEFRAKNEHQTRYIQALKHEDVESLVSFRNKASAWFYVALGGFCIACKESYELTTHEAWNIIVLVAIIGGMLLLSILNLISRLKRSKEIIRL